MTSVTQTHDQPTPQGAANRHYPNKRLDNTQDAPEGHLPGGERGDRSSALDQRADAVQGTADRLPSRVTSGRSGS